MRWIRAVLWLFFAWRDYRIHRPGFCGRWAVFVARQSWTRCRTAGCGARIFLGTDRHDGYCEPCKWWAWYCILNGINPRPDVSTLNP